ncbi:hypothetical protein [Fusobacterium sp. PH5-44]|uniref:hypothetical protein n=1 Tax=unclassified Fusobacterium TaxID=2648384 RepID=UPI003D225B78
MGFRITTRGSIPFGLLFVFICLSGIGIIKIKENFFENGVLVINNKSIRPLSNVKIIYDNTNKTVDAGEIKRESKFKEKIDTKEKGSISIEYTDYKGKSYKHIVIPEIKNKMNRIEAVIESTMNYGKITINEKK